VETLNPLADAASSEMRKLWSPTGKVLLEREFWLVVLEEHVKLGVVEDDDGAIRSALRKALPDVDLQEIDRRERVTRHDLKARLEEYLAVAGVPQVLHLGLTSADVVDNVSLIQMALTCELLSEKTNYELLSLWPNFLPFRGVKGAVGTQQDQLELLGSAAKCEQLDRNVADTFGFKFLIENCGQVYPRSIDLHWLQIIGSVTKGKAWRLLQNGFLQMGAGYAGDTWNEGDVTTSVVRRVCLQGAALTADASLETNKGEQ
jgi:adenylosuccinate lyase